MSMSRENGHLIWFWIYGDTATFDYFQIVLKTDHFHCRLCHLVPIDFFTVVLIKLNVSTLHLFYTLVDSDSPVDHM